MNFTVEDKIRAVGGDKKVDAVTLDSYFEEHLNGKTEDFGYSVQSIYSLLHEKGYSVSKIQHCGSQIMVMAK